MAELNRVKEGAFVNDTVTQDNLHLLLPIKVSYLVEMLCKDFGMSVVDAIKRVYTSATYKRLEREETKAWTLGPTTLYYDLMHEK